MNIKNIDFNINYISNPYKHHIGSGKSINEKSSFSKELNKISNNSKIDTIEFSQKTVNKSQNLPTTRNKIVRDLNEDKKTEYLNRLKNQIASNNYSIDSKELADILLL